MNDNIERVRQQARAFVEMEKVWKQDAPEGKVYRGFRFKPTEPFGGWEIVPVYEDKVGGV